MRIANIVAPAAMVTAGLGLLALAAFLAIDLLDNDRSSGADAEFPISLDKPNAVFITGPLLNYPQTGALRIAEMDGSERGRLTPDGTNAVYAGADPKAG